MGSEAEETSPVPVQSKDFPVLALNFLIKVLSSIMCLTVTYCRVVHEPTGG